MERVNEPKAVKKLLEERVRHRRFQGGEGGFAEQKQEMILSYLKCNDKNKSHPQKHLMNSKRRKANVPQIEKRLRFWMVRHKMLQQGIGCEVAVL